MRKLGRGREGYVGRGSLLIVLDINHDLFTTIYLV